jgi:FixJ family two-component response regulator
VADSTRTVYVVDDDEAVRDSAQVLLESYGIATQTFRGAEEFLAGRGHGEPACLILDIHMPGMGGLALLERLRAQGDPVPIIMVTGRSDAALRQRVERAGVTAMLDKPVEDEQLIGAVHAVFNGG